MKPDLTELLDLPAFSLGREQKSAIFRERFSELESHHRASCAEYGRIAHLLDPKGTGLDDRIFLPVRLFKEFELKSVPEEDVFKTMTSSGTSGQAVSKIILDKASAVMQTKVLNSIVANLIGKKRLPMLVIDTAATVKNRLQFSARAAAIFGFSIFGRDVTYALNEDMDVDINRVDAFMEKHSSSDILLFGFTSIVHQHFTKPLLTLKHKPALDRGILIHGGGWKKLQDIAVDGPTFKQHLQDACGIRRVHNYYGMVEQTGSIFVECEQGFLHCSNYSDVFIRNPQFGLCGLGEPGLIQVLSLLPESYPGHNLLSEDMGEIVGEDDCACGRKGKYFVVHGRAEQAEVRGCSDTFSP